MIEDLNNERLQMGGRYEGGDKRKIETNGRNRWGGR